MTFFTDKGRFRTVWNSFRQTIRRVGPNTNKQIFDIKNNAMQRMLRQKPLLIAGGAAIVLIAAGLGGTQYVKAHTIDFVEVYHDGSLIGEVSSKDQVKALIDQKQKQLELGNPGVHMVLDTGTITYKDKNVYNARPDAEATLQKLEGLFGSHATGVDLVIDGKVIGVVKDQATAEAVLKRVKETYAPQTKSAQPEVTALAYTSDGNIKSKTALKSVKFVEAISMNETSVDPKDIVDPEKLYTQLMKGTVKPKQYTVKQGDCVGCIAHEFGVSKQVIYQRNQWIKDDLIKVGDVIDLTVEQPEVTVETVENVTETESIDPSTIIQKNSSMKSGKSKVIRQGKSGKKQLVYRLVKQNGFLMTEELVSEEVLEPSVPTIIMKGTKVDISEGSGRFAWPVIGHSLTSYYGMRWGTLHRGVDMIGNSKIEAADNGIVTFTGTRPGLGNCIIINHQNGYETYYGHLSKILVKRGQTVSKGSKIGIMGNTGHSFGTHLHFEIHKNGALQNPLKFL